MLTHFSPSNRLRDHPQRRSPVQLHAHHRSRGAWPVPGPIPDVPLRNRCDHRHGDRPDLRERQGLHHVQGWVAARRLDLQGCG